MGPNAGEILQGMAIAVKLGATKVGDMHVDDGWCCESITYPIYVLQKKLCSNYCIPATTFSSWPSRSSMHFGDVLSVHGLESGISSSCGYVMLFSQYDFDNTVGIHPTNAECFTQLSITKRSGKNWIAAGGCGGGKCG